MNSARARAAVADIRATLSPFRRRGINEAAEIDAMAARWQQVA
ncbi:hypothetical protein HNR23_001063 [Nocardiopsis mwathae]|uniref:Uncharacterized protein n=1 Tax=Nocardiopsis mwathae TaxID=1472723 RepID=A0A7X0D484_9ACTN|nr:hypothetical protein [Nocardiopsis mwathae]